MRSTSVVVRAGDPVQGRAQVCFNPFHEVSGEGLEVVQVPPVLRVHDQAEMVPVAVGAIDEGLRVGRIRLCVEDLAALALSSGAVALDVAEVNCQSALGGARHRHDPHLDHHPAHAACRRANGPNPLHRPLGVEVTRPGPGRHGGRRPVQQAAPGPDPRRLPTRRHRRLEAVIVRFARLGHGGLPRPRNASPSPMYPASDFQGAQAGFYLA